MKRMRCALIFAAAAMIAFATSARAVDGTIEINQAKVLAAGGFPYVISTANTSYRLTGSLTVSSAGATAITVTANHVTIDLNGFSIAGPGPSSFGDGINGSAAGALTVENGTVTGFGIDVYTGNNSIVRNVHATASPSAGIQTGNGAVISGNTANGNGVGIFCAGSGCAIYGNTIDTNTGSGSAGILTVDKTTGYGENVLYSNGTDVSGGTSMKNNVCSGVLC